MVVVLDKGALKDIPIMKSVMVYKPIGLAKIINIFDYDNDHMKRYKKFLEKRALENKRERAQHKNLVEGLDDNIRNAPSREKKKNH